MLPNFIRQRIPEHVREDLSIALLSWMGRYKWSYWIYSQVLCDGYPVGIKFLSNWEFGYNYKGHNVRVPRDGGIVICESFQEGMYEYYPIEEGDTIIDIGAYVGTFTLKALLAVSEGGKVVAVEPSPANMKYCKRNCRHFPNVVFVQKVITDKVGRAKLYLSSGGACHSLIYPHKHSREVEATTVDSLVKDLGLAKVNLIKLDIEGANLMALAGAEETLKRSEVRLAVAAYHKQPNGKPELPYVRAFLEERGFRVHEERGYLYAKKAV